MYGMEPSSGKGCSEKYIYWTSAVVQSFLPGIHFENDNELRFLWTFFLYRHDHLEATELIFMFMK